MFRRNCFDNVTLKKGPDFLGDVGGEYPPHHPKNRKFFIECDIVKLLRLMPSQGKICKKGVHVGRVPHMHTFFAESLAQAEQLRSDKNQDNCRFFAG